MDKDFGIIALIIGIFNVLVSVEVAVFDFFLGGNLKWLIHPLIELFLNMLGMILFFLALVFGIIGIITHEVPFILDMGITLNTAATVLGLTAGIGALGKLSFGYFADRLSSKWLLLCCIALQVVGVFILMHSKSLRMVWAFVIIFAFAMGGTNTLRPLMIVEFFGLSSFGRTFGKIEIIRRFGAAAGPFAAGYIFDITTSYHYVFLAIIASYLAGLIILLTIRRVY